MPRQRLRSSITVSMEKIRPKHCPNILTISNNNEPHHPEFNDSEYEKKNTPQTLSKHSYHLKQQRTSPPGVQWQRVWRKHTPNVIQTFLPFQTTMNLTGCPEFNSSEYGKNTPQTLFKNSYHLKQQRISPPWHDEGIVLLRSPPTLAYHLAVSKLPKTTSSPADSSGATTSEIVKNLYYIIHSTNES